jgi:catechol 2,3-dioxygenase-like lactoylglutathione lyase family enzyme
MNLGAFSVSLAVKDIRASRDFYLKFGFEIFHGDVEHNWLILKNREHVIGLFQDMIDRNMLTFNPGWDQDGRETADFTDIRDLQKALKAAGLTMAAEVDESGSGPGRCIVIDPDGNPVMLDQHR